MLGLDLNHWVGIDRSWGQIEIEGIETGGVMWGLPWLAPLPSPEAIYDVAEEVSLRPRSGKAFLLSETCWTISLPSHTLELGWIIRHIGLAFRTLRWSCTPCIPNQGQSGLFDGPGALFSYNTPGSDFIPLFLASLFSNFFYFIYLLIF